MKTARAIQGADGKPREWNQLHDQVGIADGHVQRLKASARRHQSTLDELREEIALTTAEQGRQISALGDAVGAFVAVRPDLAPRLVAAAYDDERHWLEPAPQVRLPEMSAAAIEVPTPDVLALRIRPSPRPS
jgi:hypothetical protein